MEESDTASDKLIYMIKNGGSVHNIENLLTDDCNIDDVSTGWSLLQYATAYNRLDVCQLLLTHRSDVNLMTPNTGDDCNFINNGPSPFSLSCSRVVTHDIFDLFIKNGGNVNDMHPDLKQTPLFFVMKEPDTWVIPTNLWKSKKRNSIS